MNFTYKVEKPSDGEWGVKLSNNSWTGMVGMLIRQEIDIGNIFNSFITCYHKNCIHFSRNRFYCYNGKKSLHIIFFNHTNILPYSIHQKSK